MVPIDLISHSPPISMFRSRHVQSQPPGYSRWADPCRLYLASSFDFSRLLKNRWPSDHGIAPTPIHASNSGVTQPALRHRAGLGPLQAIVRDDFRRIRRQAARWIECDLFDFETLFLRARTTCPNLCQLSHKPR